MYSLKYYKIVQSSNNKNDLFTQIFNGNFQLIKPLSIYIVEYLAKFCARLYYTRHDESEKNLIAFLLLPPT